LTRSAADGAAAPPDLSRLKDAVRKAALARRDALDPASRVAAGARLADLVGGLAIPPGALVSGFWPIRSEIDPRPAMERLAARGHPLALPVIVDEGTRLIFRRWRAGDRLVVAGFGLSEPGPEAEEVAPDVLLVPLAAFDRQGDRIGYGRGYYDRAIARLEAERPRLKIGVAFSVQEAERVPTEPHDRRLDLILTEAGPVRPVPEMP
jgi:5-formyltetrahydrofolate cyclo-ligase